MRHDLKHIKTVSKRLKSGERVTYYYHRRTGKRIAAEPGTDAFLDAYRAASVFDGPVPGTLGALIAQYQADDAFQMLRERTRADYGPILSALAVEFGHAPLMAFEDPRMRKDVRAYRDRLAKRSPRQADYAISVLSSLLKYGCDDGQLSVNLAATIRHLVTERRKLINQIEGTHAKLERLQRELNLVEVKLICFDYDVGKRRQRGQRMLSGRSIKRRIMDLLREADRPLTSEGIAMLLIQKDGYDVTKPLHRRSGKRRVRKALQALGRTMPPIVKHGRNTHGQWRYFLNEHRPSVGVGGVDYP